MQIKQSEVYLMSIFGVFHATRGPYLFYYFIYLFIYLFCGVQKDISRKKIPPRFTSWRNITNFDFSSCATNSRFGSTLVLSGHSLLKMRGAFCYEERNNFQV